MDRGGGVAGTAAVGGSLLFDRWVLLLPFKLNQDPGLFNAIGRTALSPPCHTREASEAADPRGDSESANICSRSQSSDVVLANGADSCSDSGSWQLLVIGPLALPY